MAQIDPPTPETRRQRAYLRVYLVLFAAGALVSVLLPPPASSLILGALVAGSLVLAAESAGLLRRLAQVELALPDVRLRRWQEVVIVLAVLVIATGHLFNTAPDERIKGYEFSYLINSGVIAADILHETGSIPLWNPLIGSGEPLLENPFSYILNPLMSLPVFALGAIDGTKLALLLHVALMGLGGWTLAYVIGLGLPGRVLLALLLGGSGSFAAAIGSGFYQMSLSQAYMPWVYAGLIGTLYRRDRWPVLLLAVSATLLLFAGTFWYALPVALAAALLVGGRLLRAETRLRPYDGGRVGADPCVGPPLTGSLRRVMVALLLTLGLAAVRLLPQIIHHGYIGHPDEFLFDPLDLGRLLMLHFTSDIAPPFETPATGYHYILPLTFAGLLAFARLLIADRTPSHWRILLPGLVFVLLIVVWAQGGTPILALLYDLVPLLREWRWPVRLLAASAVWLALLAAVWFDDVLAYTWARRRRVVPLLASLLLVLAAAVAVTDVLHNWRRLVTVEPLHHDRHAPFTDLRQQFPNDFLPVYTSGFFYYFPHYEQRARAAFGNPDYWPEAPPPTLGSSIENMRYPPPFAVGAAGGYYFLNDPEASGYVPLHDADPVVLWHNPTTPPYTYVLELDRMPGPASPLTAAALAPARIACWHRFDAIELHVSAYGVGDVLVVGETAYPGWQVEINGQPAALEIMGRLLAVRLPEDSGDTVRVVFRYEPVWLYLGGLITVLTSAGVILWLLVPRRKATP